jgi:hypothetical protein
LARGLLAPDRLCGEKAAGSGDPPPIRSQLPPTTAEIKQENANTVTCSCMPATTVIDSRTGHTTLVCKKTKVEK